LVKSYYQSYYDKECCKEHGDCAEGESPECEESSESNSNTYEVLAKYFKPQGGKVVAEKIEFSGHNSLSEAQKQKIVNAVKDSIVELEDKYAS
jgi:hypothetical protein